MTKMTKLDRRRRIRELAERKYEEMERAERREAELKQRQRKEKLAPVIDIVEEGEQTVKVQQAVYIGTSHVKRNPDPEHDTSHAKCSSVSDNTNTSEVDTQHSEVTQSKTTIAHSKQHPSSFKLSPRRLAEVQTRAKEVNASILKDMLFFLERQQSFNVKHPVLGVHQCSGYQRNRTRVEGMLRDAGNKITHGALMKS